MAISEARKRANAKYNAKAYEQVPFRVKKGQKQVLKDIAEQQDESLNGYIKSAVQAKILDDTGKEIEL
ncbi:MAG: antitoxin [Clostridiales bacterium]|nr:antitoxin [Clostridiales bacterium]